MSLGQSISGLFQRKVSATGLAVFRMLYSIMIIVEISLLYKFRHIIFDREPFVVPGEIDFGFIYFFWMAALFALFVGLFTRVAALVNFIFGVIIFSSAIKFEYHIYYSYLGVNFLFLFLPVSKVFSLDNLILKLKHTTIGKAFSPDRNVLEINYMMPVFVGIALVYFDSIFLKLQNNLWTSGLGFWLPTSIPAVAWNDMSLILNQEWFMYFLGYFVLLFEAAFIFLFWFRKWRWPLLLIGIVFHLGIWVCYPIPLFALTYVFLYLLLLPADFWQKTGQWFISKNQVYTFYYDAECPLCNKVVVVIRHFDIFNRVICKTVQGNFQDDPAISAIDEQTLYINIHGVTKSGKVYVGFWAYVQLFKALGYTYPLALLISLPGISHLGRKLYNYIAGDRLTVRCTLENCTIPVFTEPVPETQDVLVKGWNRLAVTRNFWKYLIAVFFVFQCLLVAGVVPGPLESVGRKYLGLTRHSVFLDFHFQGYNHELKVMYVDASGREELVPIINEDGTPGSYAIGPTWRNISFDVVSAVIKPKKICDRLPAYLLFYLDEHQIDASNAQFNIYFKEIDTPNTWEKDFFKNQMKKPWIKAGNCEFDASRQATFGWTPYATQLFKAEAE